MSAPSTTSASAGWNPSPWVRHLVSGAASIAVGFVLLRTGVTDLGITAIGAGLGFLGVGVGSATTSAAPT